MVIDGLTKEKYYILYIVDENDTITEVTVYLLFNNI